MNMPVNPLPVASRAYLSAPDDESKHDEADSTMVIGLSLGPVTGRVYGSGPVAEPNGDRANPFAEPNGDRGNPFAEPNGDRGVLFTEPNGDYQPNGGQSNGAWHPEGQPATGSAPPVIPAPAPGDPTLVLPQGRTQREELQNEREPQH